MSKVQPLRILSLEDDPNDAELIQEQLRSEDIACELTRVDTQAAFDEVLETYYPATIGWDRVHPNQTGNMILARAFLKSVGFQW